MADLQDLAPLVARPAPVVTAYLNARSDRTDADDRLRVEWVNARRDAAASGAPEPALEALDRLAADVHHADGAAVVAVVAADGSTWHEALLDPVAHDLVAVDTLPRLAPVIEVRQRSVPHLVVVADRVGADLVAVADGVAAESRLVEGSDVDVHRGAPGGWSQRRFQQRAENRWEDNARGVADEVGDLARRVGARVVVVAGDERALAALRDHVDADTAGLVREVAGSRHGDPEAVAEEAVRLAATEAASEVVERLEAFASARGRGAAVDGAEATLAALGEGRVERLLVHDDPDDDRRARISADRRLVAAAGVDTTGLGTELVDARLVDAAVTAALTTGAAITIVPAAGRNAPADGLGAVLRGGGTG
jgi:peptide subunit release factor 1 (eRF1)